MMSHILNKNCMSAKEVASSKSLYTDLYPIYSLSYVVWKPLQTYFQ